MSPVRVRSDAARHPRPTSERTPDAGRATARSHPHPAASRAHTGGSSRACDNAALPPAHPARRAICPQGASAGRARRSVVGATLAVALLAAVLRGRAQVPPLHHPRTLPLPPRASSHPRRPRAAATRRVQVPTTSCGSSPPARAAFAGAARRCGCRRSAGGSGRPGVRRSARRAWPSRAPPRARWPAGCRRAGSRSARPRVHSRWSRRMPGGQTTRARQTGGWRHTFREGLPAVGGCKWGSSGLGVGSDGTRHASSPAMPSASRLLARMRVSRLACIAASANLAQASMRCSQLSRMSSSSFGRSHSSSVASSGRPCSSRTPNTEAMVSGSSAGSESGASSMNHTPSGRSGRRLYIGRDLQ